MANIEKKTENIVIHFCVFTDIQTSTVVLKDQSPCFVVLNLMQSSGSGHVKSPSSLPLVGAHSGIRRLWVPGWQDELRDSQFPLRLETLSSSLMKLPADGSWQD